MAPELLPLQAVPLQSITSWKWVLVALECRVTVVHEDCPVLPAREHSQAVSTALRPQQSSKVGDQRGAGSPAEDSCSASSCDRATIQGQFRAGFSKDSHRVLRFRGGFGEAWELRKRILSLLKLFFFFRMRREKSHQITNF